MRAATGDLVVYVADDANGNPTIDRQLGTGLPVRVANTLTADPDSTGTLNNFGVNPQVAAQGTNDQRKDVYVVDLNPPAPTGVPLNGAGWLGTVLLAMVGGLTLHRRGRPAR